jgi:hypothetical protein
LVALMVHRMLYQVSPMVDELLLIVAAVSKHRHRNCLAVCDCFDRLTFVNRTTVVDQNRFSDQQVQWYHCWWQPVVDAMAVVSAVNR